MNNTDTTPIINHNNTLTINGYINTAIGNIPVDWDIKLLKDISDIYLGLTYTPKYIEKGIPFLSVKDINKGKLDFSKVKYISIDEFEKSTNNAKPTKGDILFGRVGTLGNPILIKTNIDFCIFVSLGYLRLKKKEYNHNFIIHWMWSDIFCKQVNNNVAGSSQKNLNTGWLRNFQLPFPPLPEQKKIAEILSTWDEAIILTKKTIKKLTNRNKGLAQQLHSGKKRLSGFSERWEVKKIKDFSMDVSIKNKNDDDLVVLSCTKHNGLVPSLEYFGRKIYSDNLKTYKIVEKNVFAYATNHIEEGSIGYQSKYEKALISPMYTVFKTDDDINDEFLFRVLKSNTYIQEYQKRMEGSIDRRGGLRWQEFSKIKVSVPSYEEQTAIALALETADQELKSYETKLEALQLQKKGLMQQLLTGKIRVNVK